MRTLPKPMTVAEIAQLAGGRVDGPAELKVASLATLEDAGENDVAFLENPKYESAAALCAAGCLILPPSAKDLPTRAKARVFADEPRTAFAALVRLVDAARRGALLRTVSAKASIHYQAKMGPNVSVGDFTVIDKGAVVAENTTIGPLCYIGENAKIGRNVLIHARVVIREDCVIGDNVILQPGCVIGSDGFGFTTDKKTGKHTKIPQIGNVVVKENAEIGANTTIDRAAVGSTVVGPGTQIDNLVQIAHNVKTGRDCVIVSQVGVAGSTTLGNNVVLAGQAGLVGHLTVGDGVVVTAQTGVMSDVPPKTTLFGSPGRPHREAFKLQALYGRLPELYEKVKQLEKKLVRPQDEDEPNNEVTL